MGAVDDGLEQTRNVLRMHLCVAGDQDQHVIVLLKPEFDHSTHRCARAPILRMTEAHKWERLEHFYGIICRAVIHDHNVMREVCRETRQCFPQFLAFVENEYGNQGANFGRVHLRHVDAIFLIFGSVTNQTSSDRPRYPDSPVRGQFKLN